MGLFGLFSWAASVIDDAAGEAKLGVGGDGEPGLAGPSWLACGGGLFVLVGGGARRLVPAVPATSWQSRR